MEPSKLNGIVFLPPTFLFWLLSIFSLRFLSCSSSYTNKGYIHWSTWLYGVELEFNGIYRFVLLSFVETFGRVEIEFVVSMRNDENCGLKDIKGGGCQRHFYPLTLNSGREGKPTNLIHLWRQKCLYLNYAWRPRSYIWFKNTTSTSQERISIPSNVPDWCEQKASLFHNRIE